MDVTSPRHGRILAASVSTSAVSLVNFSELLLAAAAPAICPAQDCDCYDRAWLSTTPQLTGDWFGARSSLAESGVTVLADNTNFYFGNTAGGVTRDFDFAGHGDYIVNMDGGKLLGQEGLFIKLKAEHRFGETIDQRRGRFISPTSSRTCPSSAASGSISPTSCSRKSSANPSPCSPARWTRSMAT